MVRPGEQVDSYGLTITDVREVKFRASRSPDGIRVSRDRLIGWIGVIGAFGLGAFVVLRGVADGIRICVGLWAFAWVVWVAVVRPQIAVRNGTVVLTNPLRVVSIPAALITDVSLGAYLQIAVSDRAYTSAVVGRPRERRARAGRTAEVRPHQIDNATLVLDSIRAAGHHVDPAGPGGVTQRWDLLPLGVLVALAVAGLLSFAL